MSTITNFNKINTYTNNNPKSSHSKSKSVSEATYKVFSDLITDTSYKIAKIAAGVTIGTAFEFLTTTYPKIKKSDEKFCSTHFIQAFKRNQVDSAILLENGTFIPGLNLGSIRSFAKQAFIQIALQSIVWDSIIAPISEYTYGPRKEWENNKTTKAIKILSLSAINLLINFIIASKNPKSILSTRHITEYITRMLTLNLIKYTASEYLGSLGGISTTAGAYLGARTIATIFGPSFIDKMDSQGFINKLC